MMNLTVSYDSQSKLYHAGVFTGPDCIDCASFSCSSLGEIFEKVTVFIAINGLTYCESPEEGIKSYFQSIEQK